jgi:hypothetical protein
MQTDSFVQRLNKLEALAARRSTPGALADAQALREEFIATIPGMIEWGARECPHSWAEIVAITSQGRYPRLRREAYANGSKWFGAEGFYGLVALVIGDAKKLKVWGDWFNNYRNRYSLGDGGWYDKRARWAAMRAASEEVSDDVRTKF